MTTNAATITVTETKETGEVTYWSDLFWDRSDWFALFSETWAARWEHQTLITDRFALWDAGAVAGHIDRRLPALASGMVCHGAADPELHRVTGDRTLAEHTANTWRELVINTAPDTDDVDAWEAARITWSDYRTDHGRIGTTGDGTRAVFLGTDRVDLLARLDLTAHQFDPEGRLHLTAAEGRIAALVPTNRTARTDTDPVLAAIAN
ncbi:hypothetical protein AB0K52_15145 [Glycomyces sp. NPDC049804]|uniref:hypothetical protein n=1 Tax=Glycomyces sp. NPDC049804 TaxID=3154363 RepID=UPI003426ED7A